MIMLSRKWTKAVCICALGLLVCGQGGQKAQAQSLSRLRAKLRDTIGRRKQVERELKNVKAEEATARHELSKVQKELEEARGRLNGSKAELRKVERDLRQVKERKEKTEAQLGQHSTAMSQRLLAMYRVGTPSYLEVVLNATDFEDFANRAEFTRLVAQQDEALLSELVGAKKELTEQKAIIEDYRQVQTELVKQVQYETAVVDKRKRAADQLVGRTKKSRALLEAEWTAHLNAAKEIEEYIRQSSSGRSRGRLRYTGTCAGRFLMPVRGPITSPYGMRLHPILKVWKHHSGIDIGARTGTPIKAGEKGLVTHSGWWGALGKCVIIDHGSGWHTYYGHCSRLLVKKGDYVTRGEVIARVGNTGRSTGPHLHWTVMHNGKTLDPLKL